MAISTLLLTSSGQGWHICTLVLTSSHQEWQFDIATDIYWSRYASRFLSLVQTSSDPNPPPYASWDIHQGMYLGNHFVFFKKRWEFPVVFLNN